MFKTVQKDMANASRGSVCPSSARSRRTAPEAAAIEGYFESWKIAQVLKVYGKSRSSLLAEVKAGTFPAPFQNGDTNLWHSGEVLTEMRRRIDACRSKPRKKVVGKHKSHVTAIQPE